MKDVYVCTPVVGCILYWEVLYIGGYSNSSHESHENRQSKDISFCTRSSVEHIAIHK